MILSYFLKLQFCLIPVFVEIHSTLLHSLKITAATGKDVNKNLRTTEVTHKHIKPSSLQRMQPTRLSRPQLW